MRPTDHPENYQFIDIASASSGCASKQGHTQFRALADVAPVLIWMTDKDRRCEYFNRGWLDFTGRTLEQELGAGWTDGLFADDRQRVLIAYEGAARAGRPFEIEYRLRRRDGTYRWLLSSGVPRFTSSEDFAGHVGSCVDITEHKQAQLELEQLLAASDEAQARLQEQTRQLHQLAEADPLTGVLNRRSFRDRAEREWSRSLRHGHALSCIMLDIDFFKRINDTCGHAAGDAILKGVAETLLQQCRPSDLVCRYGGEEFCILLPETDENGAATMAERLRSTLATRQTQVGEHAHIVTSSFGVAERFGYSDELDELIERADHALHIAKHSGRNRVVRFASESLVAAEAHYEAPAQVLAEITAADLMTPSACIRSDETIERAAELLISQNLGSVPVVDENGLLVGFISERDLMVVNVSREAWSQCVGDIMKTNVVCYEEETPGNQVFQFLSRVSIHRVVVVKGGRPTGVISPTSLLRFFQQRLASEAACSAF